MCPCLPTLLVTGILLKVIVCVFTDVTSRKVQTAESSVDPGHTAPGSSEQFSSQARKKPERHFLKNITGICQWNVKSLVCSTFFKATILFHKVSKFLNIKKLGQNRVICHVRFLVILVYSCIASRPVLSVLPMLFSCPVGVLNKMLLHFKEQNILSTGLGVREFELNWILLPPKN